MMKRRFRSRARWSFADSTTLAVQGGGAQTAWVWLLPPARVAQMLSTRGRGNSLIYAGSHLWLDFLWKNTGSPTGLCDTNFGVIKTTISDPIAFTPDLSLVDAQWDQPSTPGSVTSWDEDDDSGTDSWLWQHWIKGFSPPNALVQTAGLSGIATINQANIIGTGSVDNPAFVCRKFCVTQEWQPDVVVRSKRRLQKDEGILLYMNAVPGLTTLECILNVHQRTLTK